MSASEPSEATGDVPSTDAEAADLDFQRAREKTGQTLRLLWSTAAQHPARLAVILVLPILNTLSSSFAGPFVIAILISRIQDGTVSLDTSWGLIWAYAITQLYGHVIGWRITLWAHWTLSLAGMQALYERVFSHLTHQSMAFHADRFSGSLVNQTNKLIRAFDLMLESLIWNVLPVLTSVVAAVLILLPIMPGYAIFLLLMCLLFAGTVLFASRRMRLLTVREAQAHSRMTGFLADVMSNIAAVKSQGSEVRELRSAGEVSDRWVAADRRVMRAFLLHSTAFSSVIAVTNVAAVIAAIVATQNQTIDIAGIYLALTYTLMVTSMLWQINQILRNYNTMLGDAYDMVDILGKAPTVADDTNREFRRGPGLVEFDGIRFTHDGDSQPLFDNFSLTIAPGEKIGLVGHSGSGKSTLIRLLLRFSDVDGGSVRVDGVDVRAVTQASLRQQIAYVPQEPLLFHRSLAENIGYGAPEASEVQIRTAAVKAQAAQFIDDLPDGFGTTVGERGVKLSGGQRQRVAIARAIIKDAELLVLDEATSALDSESEARIQQALTEAMQGRTTIVIAHRLSTVQQMDRIVVLDQGRIAEQGSHQKLIARQGPYARLWAHQSGGFLGS